MSSPIRVAIIVLIIAAAGAAFIRWRRPPHPAPARPVAARPMVSAAPPAAAPPARNAILHPVPRDGTLPGALPVLEHSDAYLRNALDELLGRKATQAFLSLDDIARRLVATLNNLATDNAAADMWPVKRTSGPFLTDALPGGGTVISPRNSERYLPFVRLVDGVNTQRAAALYVRFYPVFQRAYEELGFPDRYLNDRVVEVIDHLVATPTPAEPIRVKLITAAPGAANAAGTGGLYVFEDPALETSSSGQKILLRMGRENAARLKAKLTEFRQRIATGSMPPR